VAQWGRKSKDETEFYVPYNTQVSAKDFKVFSQLPIIFFEAKTRQQKLYNK